MFALNISTNQHLNMKLSKILLLERVIEHNRDEYLQVVALCKQHKRYNPTHDDDDVAGFLCTLVGEFEQLEYDLYERWFGHMGTKQDRYDSTFKLKIPAKKGFIGFLVPNELLAVGRYLSLIDQDVVDKLFPPKIAKLIARGIEFANVLFDESQIVRGLVLEKDKQTAIAVRRTREEFEELLHDMDTWVNLMSRVEFYSRSIFDLGEDDVGEDSHNIIFVMSEYASSELTKYVFDQYRSLEQDAKHDMNEEELYDYYDQINDTLAHIITLIATCLQLSHTSITSSRFVNIEYAIDPKTKEIVKEKNKHGKMVPIINLKYQDEKDDVLTNDDGVSKKTQPLGSRYTVNVDTFGNKELEKYRKIVAKIIEAANHITGIFREDTSLTEEEFQQKHNKEWNFEEYRHLRRQSVLCTFYSIRYLHNQYLVFGKLSSNDNDEPYSETNIPKEMVKFFQEIEDEIVSIAKVIGWL